jgi:DNA-binding protein YbaB
MSDPLSSAGPDAAARVDQWVARAKAKAARYQAMQAAVGQVSVTESSQDGVVTVTVDSAGNVTDLRITDQVKEMSGARVSSAVLATLRRAQSRLPERLGEVMAAIIGDDQRTMDTIVGNYRSKFPEPPEEEQAEEPPPAAENVRRIGGIEAETPQPRPERRPAGNREKDSDNGDDGDDEDFGRSYLVRE